MRARRVLIRGAGLAGLAAAKLLLDRGAEVRVDAPSQRRGRVVAVPVETLMLAAELFKVDRRELEIGPIVHERVVDWSAEGPGVVAQVALVCDADALAAALARPLWDAGVMREGDETADADWVIDATGRPGEGAARGGERVGCFARVTGVAFEPRTRVTVTSDGWVFTAPHPSGGLSVLLIAPSLLRAPATADEVAAWLGRAGRPVAASAVVEVGRAVAVAPCLAEPLLEGDRVSVGEAAVALDPLRGDGTGFALRGALLAQAVLAAIEGGRERAGCVAHYERRVRGVFVSHLRGCSAHYRAARHGELWAPEVAAMDRLADRFDHGAEHFGYRLVGVDLVPMSEGSVESRARA